jgi:alpha-galactosidase
VKIAFVGGASVKWGPKLIVDMAVTPVFQGARLVLHDIDSAALDVMDRAGKRLVALSKGQLEIETTLDLSAALEGADFVILCVSIGGLPAMRNDLEIPKRYGIRQTVGDTVGPGGLARGLRHIPFALRVAREMEQRCPDAWLLNLTNPMTTICRAVGKATRIRTIGLCHEVGGRLRHLSSLFTGAENSPHAAVAGINHIPLLLRFGIGSEDGFDLLDGWLASHDPYQFVHDRDPDPVKDGFRDRLALKFFLYQKLGVFFGAGDRHIVEFLHGFLTEKTGYGAAYGIRPTRVESREELLRRRRVIAADIAAGGPVDISRSNEQLVSIISALMGGPPGRFVVNIPNEGQIRNLARDAVVECSAEVSARGIKPVAIGKLPGAAEAIIAPHVARQELIVDAALARDRSPALAALMTDPLIQDPATVEPMLEDLLAANQHFLDLDQAIL